MGKKKVKKTATANLYRVKRECYIGRRRYHRGDRVAIDVEAEGIPSHHFEPLDGGPVEDAPVLWPRGQRSRAPGTLRRGLARVGHAPARLGAEPTQ